MSYAPPGGSVQAPFVLPVHHLNDLMKHFHLLECVATPQKHMQSWVRGTPVFAVQERLSGPKAADFRYTPLSVRSGAVFTCIPFCRRHPRCRGDLQDAFKFVGLASSSVDASDMPRNKMGYVAVAVDIDGIVHIPRERVDGADGIEVGDVLAWEVECRATEEDGGMFDCIFKMRKANCDDRHPHDIVGEVLHVPDRLRRHGDAAFTVQLRG